MLLQDHTDDIDVSCFDAVVMFDAAPRATTALVRATASAAVPLYWNPGGLPHVPIDSVATAVGESMTLLMNRVEFRTTFDIDAAPDPVSAVRNRLGIRQLVVTLGAQGALLATAAETSTVPSAATTVADGTGAGDAFTAAFALAHLATGDHLHALHVGCAAGAMAVATLGARVRLPPLSELITSTASAAGR